MRNVTLRAAIVACICSASALAWADPAPTAPRARRGEITVETVNIPGRLPRPMAAVDVARVTTRVAIPLRSFSPAGRIEAATRRAPF